MAGARHIVMTATTIANEHAAPRRRQLTVNRRQHVFGPGRRLQCFQPILELAQIRQTDRRRIAARWWWMAGIDRGENATSWPTLRIAYPVSYSEKHRRSHKSCLVAFHISGNRTARSLYTIRRRNQRESSIENTPERIEPPETLGHIRVIQLVVVGMLPRTRAQSRAQGRLLLSARAIPQNFGGEPRELGIVLFGRLKRSSQFDKKTSDIAHRRRAINSHPGPFVIDLSRVTAGTCET